MPIAVDTRTTRRQTSSTQPGQRQRFREAADVWSDIATGWADALDDAFTEMVDAMGDLDSRSGRRRATRRACGCEHDECSRTRDCSDTCHCRCCISDADLVVYARLGEVRVVPIRVENHRRRAREITLDLSEFRTSGGRAVPLQAAVVGERSFDLDACEERIVTLAIRPGQLDGDDNTDGIAENSADRFAVERGDLPDVDDCLVAYADLRVAGCDIRPIRIAVALLPRDCDAYVAECGCGCC